MYLGAWGIIAAPIFRTDGLIFGASDTAIKMIIWNPIGAACLSAFHLVTSAILFTALHRLDLFRVAPNQEMEGLDIIKHDEPAYGFGKYAHVKPCSTAHFAF